METIDNITIKSLLESQIESNKRSMRICLIIMFLEAFNIGFMVVTAIIKG